MVKIILYVILALIFTANFLLYKAYRLLPPAELRRRARGSSDHSVATVYHMASYGSAFELLVWLVGGASGATLLVGSADYAWWLALVLTMLITWLVLFVNPLHDTQGVAWGLSARLAPLATLVLANAEKLLGKAGFHFTRATHYRAVSSGVYDREDLIELLQHQIHQPGNRLSEAELQTAANALTFADKKLAKFMVPTKKVRTVGVNQSVGPLLMDELHKSGFRRFPVVNDTNSAKPKIVGTLFLDDILEHTEKARVRELMSRGISYINENQDLRVCLNQFLKTQHYLLAVVDDTEEIVGVITLEDVLAQLLPAEEGSLEHFIDADAIATRQPKKEQLTRKVVE